MAQKAIYSRIKDITDSRKMSIRELETQLKFANGTISKWDKNANLPKLQMVADYLNVTVDYLLGKNSDTMKKPSQVDIADDDVIMTYEGRPIPKEDLEYIKRILNGGK